MTGAGTTPSPSHLSPSQRLYGKVSRTDRARQKGQEPCVIWFTGLSGAGKSTTAIALEHRLVAQGRHTYLLDGDELREGLSSDLSFDDTGRSENIRRLGEVARLFTEAGLIVITAFISPFRLERDQARKLIPEGKFVEVYVETPLTVCEQRDPKNLYQRARQGKINNFTGIDSRYEAPETPEVTINTASLSTEQAVDAIMRYLHEGGIL